MAPKDSPEVTDFMALYSRLKDWCDDVPEDLPTLCETDCSIRDLSLRLHLSSSFLRHSERLHPELFSSPVDPTFIIKWREYEKKYEPILSTCFLLELLREINIDEKNDSPATDEPQTLDKLWRDADEDASRFAAAVDGVIEFAHEQVSQSQRAFDEEFADTIKDGVAEWRGLQVYAGFDLRGVLRRRQLVPFVLVPRQIAAKSESARRMLRNLQQAQEAFVFGVPYAALALMRSIMEVVLRENYGAHGANLRETIDNTDGQLLPDEAHKVHLHGLRILANDILHVERDQDGILENVKEMNFERKVLSFLFILRALIEGRGGGRWPSTPGRGGPQARRGRGRSRAARCP